VDIHENITEVVTVVHSRVIENGAVGSPLEPTYVVKTSCNTVVGTRTWDHCSYMFIRTVLYIHMYMQK
jgi:hypothetical protein